MIVKVLKVADILKDAVESSNEIVKEMERLYSVEKRVSEELEELKTQISGLDKAVGFSSISFEARKVLECTLKVKKERANHLAWVLGQSEAYKIERS